MEDTGQIKKLLDALFTDLANLDIKGGQSQLVGNMLSAIQQCHNLAISIEQKETKPNDNC